MVHIQDILNNLESKNPNHQRVLLTLNKMASVLDEIVDSTKGTKKKELSSSDEKILSSIDTNIQFNQDIINTKDRRGEIPRANVFKLNAVVAATRLASRVEDFTRIEIIPVNSKSDSALKAIFVARNIDGVLESSNNSIIKLTTSSDTKQAIAALQEKEKFETTLTKDLDSLHKSIETQLENGVGTRYQLLEYNKTKATKNFEKIAELTQKGKSQDEISEELNITVPGLKAVENEVKAKVDEKIITSKKTDIKKAIDSKKTYVEIAKEIGVNQNRLAVYCKENDLLEYNEKQFIKDKLPDIEKSLKEGKSFETIAKDLNVNQARLTSIAKNNKLLEVEKKSEQVKEEKKAS